MTKPQDKTPGVGAKADEKPSYKPTPVEAEAIKAYLAAQTLNQLEVLSGSLPSTPHVNQCRISPCSIGRPSRSFIRTRPGIAERHSSAVL